jgi:transcriptional regulator with PAS, ATPase and Fis domain
MADGGTLFLDEIGDVSLKTQVDLLRVLEEKKICRVGGNAELAVDFRLVAATNRNLETLLAEGSFREDLYYRINVFSIVVPPLRERREDISLLARHFLAKYSRAMNRPVAGFSREAAELMARYDWPGNVRELQNAVERAVLVSRSSEIQAADLPLRVSDTASAPIGKSLADLERHHIARVLAETNWNIVRSARELGIDRVTLYNKIKKYDLKRRAAAAV